MNNFKILNKTRQLKTSFIAFLCLALAIVSSSAMAARTTTYFHSDGLGSVVAATDDNGDVLWRKTYAPFGEQLSDDSDGEKIAYTGKRHDSLTGLTDFGARQYDPEIGRFLSVDPIGFVESNPMSFNRYAYVNNNPYKYVDPDGEFLNFAAKFVLDVGINVAFNYVTTGQLNVGGALKESAVGILNPAKTIAKAGKLAKHLAKSKQAKNITCVLSCFVAGTEILTENGFAAIETLQVGDYVWATDPDTGLTALKPIVDTFINYNDAVWELTLRKEGETYLHEVTGSHPYYVINKGWIEVADLQPGDEIQALEGESAFVESLVNTFEVVPTYNFEVADIHTYYVSSALVLVHNCKVTNKTPSGGAPALKGDPYHPDSVTGRQKDWQKAYGGFDPKAVASTLGYGKRIAPQKAPFNSHGQPVFSNGKGYISPDIDGHNVTNGWKMFDKNGRRTGTWNSDLSKRLKD